MPVGNVFVGDAGGDIEHDDTALAVDVVAIAQSAKLFLTGGVPDVENDLTQVLCDMSDEVLNSREKGDRKAYGGEAKRVNFDTERCNVLLLEFSSQVALDKGGLFKALLTS